MDKQHIKGAAKEVAGKIQKNTGDLLDDPAMEAKGAAKEVAGKAQQKVGDAKDAMRKASADVKAADTLSDDKTPRRPSER